jgi:hypothetical protein
MVICQLLALRRIGPRPQLRLRRSSAAAAGGKTAKFMGIFPSALGLRLRVRGNLSTEDFAGQRSVGTICHWIDPRPLRRSPRACFEVQFRCACLSLARTANDRSAFHSPSTIPLPMRSCWYLDTFQIVPCDVASIAVADLSPGASGAGRTRGCASIKRRAYGRNKS